jgi:eukaryotic-like serine/threonine-protein kinase
MRLATGQHVNGYEVLRHLGTGGMSESYLARDATGAQVVLKLPHPHLIGDLSTYSRFEREVEIGRRLDHPNVQRVLGSGRLAGGIAPYLVTEFVVGQTLREYLDEHKPLPIAEAVALGTELTAALAYCHQHGVVHRDLKPENVVITQDGVPKLMDFGIALLQGARRVTWGTLSSAVGTPDYMAPEQVRGDRGDERTDVYAIGVILFEMLTGDVPYNGDNALAIMSQKVNQDAPAVTALRPEVPPALAYVVGRALQRDPNRRYPSMAALAHDLTHLDDVDLSVPLDLTTGSSGLPAASVTWLVLALVLAFLVGLGFVAELVHRAQVGQ